jgi:hypothetical protein
MSATAKRRKTTASCGVARAAADVAIGGIALATAKAIEAADQVVDRAAGALGNARSQARKAAAGAHPTAREVIGDTDGRAYEDRTRDDLYALAADREIDGRSTMRKAELIAALRAEQ